MTHEHHRSCIDACVRCAEVCEHCADACLGEADVKDLAECIRLDRDCAELCWLAAGFTARGSRLAGEVCRACAEACDACGAECDRHEHAHCRLCAEECRRCAEECRKMVGSRHAAVRLTETMKMACGDRVR